MGPSDRQARWQRMAHEASEKMSDSGPFALNRIGLAGRRFTLVVFALLAGVVPPLLGSVAAGGQAPGHGNGDAGQIPIGDPSRPIIMRGSTTVAPIAKAFADRYTAAHPDVRIAVEATSSGDGAKALINKRCDVACMSRFMKDEEFDAALAAGVHPVLHVVGVDGIAVIVHPDNPVGELNMDQLRGIFGGDITNWNQLGGPDEGILVVLHPPSSGTRALFSHTVMRGDPFGRSEYLDDNPSVRARVSNTHAAIGFVSLGFLEGVKPVTLAGVEPNHETVATGEYPIVRPLYLVTDGYPPMRSHLHRLVTAHRRSDGQKAVTDAGYVPVEEYVELTAREAVRTFWPWLLAGLGVFVSLAFFALYIWVLNRRLLASQNVATSEAAKLRSMIEGMDEGIVVANADDVITNVNDWLLHKAGCEREALVGKSLWDLHPHSAGTARLRMVLQKYRDGQHHGVHVVNRELLEMHLSLRVQPIFEDDQYRGVILNMINVTDLVAARLAAEDASRTKSQFLANMSHEIRTPMTAILGFSDVLLGNLEEEDNLLAADIIKRNGKHLLSVINDILDLSKIEAGKLEIERLDCSPAAVVADVASLMRVRAEAKGLALEIEHAGGIPQSILCDPTRLRQILINLVGNAIKFTETGSIRLVTRLVQSTARPPFLQFDVIDTGIGISRKQASKLFHPFTQADSSTTKKFGGTGLGLTISKRLAEALGGDITISSSPGKGSTFSVTIDTGPLDGVSILEMSGEAVTDKGRTARVPAAASVKLDCRILLVEDGPDNQRLIAFVLEKAGAEVSLASNGQVACDKVLSAMGEGRPFDVILMDIQMPIMDGYEATRRLRHAGYTAPIIALTANAMSGDDQKCIDAGCDDYLSKPIDQETFLPVVAKFAEKQPDAVTTAY